MSDNIPKDPDLGSRPMSLSQARRKCEDAADILIANSFGYWAWLSDRQLRVYNEKHEPIATLHVETVQ